MNPSPVYNRAVLVATPLDQTGALAGIQSYDWGLIHSVIQFDIAGDRVVALNRLKVRSYLGKCGKC